MPQYDASNLVVHPNAHPIDGVVVEVTPERAGWDYINFQVRQLGAGETWSWETGEHELALVPLSGSISVESNHNHWHVGGRNNVFSGLPHALFLSRNTAFSVTTTGESEFAVAWVRAEQEFPPRLVSPQDISVEIRGGDHATRQINGILPPGFPCQRLIIVEVYTPGGNWSSYPPHKHDVHRTNDAGTIVEADLEEIYFYKFDKPTGFAFQRIYTGQTSPLHQAGMPIDAAILARNNDAVIVPEGYHPVSSPVGYTTYYLNILAGSAQSLANEEDPHHAWVKDFYQQQDARVPVYDLVQ